MTNLACASLLRVKPQYITLSVIPNLLNGFARGLYSLLSMREDPLSTRHCTNAKKPLPSSSSRKSVRASAYRQGVCLSIVQLSTCSKPSCKAASSLMTRASKIFWESSRRRPNVSLMGPRRRQSSSLAGSAEMSTLYTQSDIDPEFRIGITTVSAVSGKGVSLLQRTTWNRRSAKWYRGSYPAAHT